MASHSSTLAWRIPWTEEPGGLQTMGLLRVVMTEWLHFHFSLSCIGEGNGNPLQCPCLENPRDGGAWWAAVCAVAQSRTQLKRLSSSKGMWVGKNKPCLQRKMSRYIWLEVGFSQYKRGVGGWVGNNLEQGSEYQIKEFKLLSGKKMPKVFSFNFKKVYI